MIVTMDDDWRRIVDGSIYVRDNLIESVGPTQDSPDQADQVINAAGNYAKQMGQMIGLDFPVTPDSHEGAITEPVQRFFGPMVVDLRPSQDPATQDSANFYFYQNNEGLFYLLKRMFL